MARMKPRTHAPDEQQGIPMSIEFLRALAKCRAPLTLTEPQDINNLLVLRAAGLVVALTLRPEAGGREVARFLTLTPDGRSLLDLSREHPPRQCGEVGAPAGWQLLRNNASAPQEHAR